MLDLSNTYGRNSFEYDVKNTNNSSMGDQSPTEFDAGSHSFAQNTINADFTRTVPAGSKTINLAFGGEFRLEKYQIKAGQEESWKLYTINENGIAGAQSFPGFTPQNAVTGDRNSFALYGDADINFSSRFLLDERVRRVLKFLLDLGQGGQKGLFLVENAGPAQPVKSLMPGGRKEPGCRFDRNPFDRPAFQGHQKSLLQHIFGQFKLFKAAD